MREKQAKNLNELRQKRLTQDTDKLLMLATELKTEVDKPAQGAVPGKALSQVGQIQKLARSVRDKMRAN